RSLALSYERMTEEQRRRFRLLGVFAAETPITAEAAMALWGLDGEHALREAGLFLRELADLALLVERGRGDGPLSLVYRQHGLLHLYALALLVQEQEINSARWAHTRYYIDLVWQAERTVPNQYPLLDLHIQNLLEALQWSLTDEPLLFSQLVEGAQQFLFLRGQ